MTHTEKSAVELFSMYTTYLITILQRHGHILSILRHLRY